MKKSDIVLLQMCGHWNNENPSLLATFWHILLASAAKETDRREKQPSSSSRGSSGIRTIVTGCMPQHFFTRDATLAPYLGNECA
jgi:hypothetical protein